MSEHELPEDLKQWPRDPHQLLGTKPGVAPKALRQAYTRLIRRFKPEQFPEHFRRIREAYDQVQAYGWYDFSHNPVAETPATPPEPGLAIPELPEEAQRP